MINSSKKEQVNQFVSYICSLVTVKVRGELVNQDLTKPDNSKKMRGKRERREEPASYKTMLDAMFSHLPSAFLLLDGTVSWMA